MEFDVTKKLKVVHVGRDIADTGGGRVIMEISKYMVEAGCEVIILTDVHVQSLDCDKAIPIHTTMFGSSLYHWKPSSRFGRIARHFMQLFIFSILGAFIARRLEKDGWIIINHNIEIFGGDILVLHNVFSAEHVKDKRGVQQKGLRFFNPIFVFRLLRERLMLHHPNVLAVSAVSLATKEEAIPYVAKGKRLLAINNGVDAELYKPLPASERNKLRLQRGVAENFVIVFVGHEFERKGLAPLIESLRLLPDIVRLWVIGGRGSTKANYEKLAEDSGVAERVLFMGTVNPLIYYQLADVFVLPSYYETWALVGLEAMASGIPALMMPVGGIVEYLKDGQNGFFILQDPHNIADKIKLLMDAPERLKIMGTKAKETALNYSWQSVAKQYMELVKTVVAEKAA